MSGRTGKMTADEIEERGPRHVLVRDVVTGKLEIFLDGEHRPGRHTVVAKSYSMSYLKKVAKFNA